MPPDRAVLEELATANRILFQQGVVDGFGHVSMRHPDHPDHFLLARSMAPAMVTADDIMQFDPDSEPTDSDPRRPYLERFIHGEIYRIRPDVAAVVHSHSPSVVPFGIVPTVTLRPVFHMSGFLGQGAPVFEIRCCAGDSSDMLIRDRTLGAALAVSLGEHATVLMRGHGSTVVGQTLRQAVFRAVYTEVNARLQGDALRLGEPTYLSPGEAAASTQTNNGQLNRSWDMWAAQAASSPSSSIVKE
ncbi:class II aldolase/adducin family protein [Acidisphaera sp. S103]|uniref:class II aldolase/adducin family protein n=1 Tax=Acidisphaera sp. S103 TaxID=1747223 RepID=UPI00131D5AFA|nr:class II aldolase/adducin family protein [Acidisphaera sp. S103]